MRRHPSFLYILSRLERIVINWKTQSIRIIMVKNRDFFLHIVKNVVKNHVFLPTL